MALDLSQIGHILWTLTQYEQALDYHQRALAIREKCDPSSHFDIALDLLTIGIILYAQKKYNEALDFHQQALAIREKCYPSDYIHIAERLTSIGAILYAQRKYDEALDYHQRALAIREEYYPPSHPALGHNSIAISVILHKQGKNDKALEFSPEGLKFEEPHQSSSNFPTAQISTDLGNISHSQEKYNEIVDRHQEAITIQEKYYAPEQVFVAETLNNTVGSIQLDSQSQLSDDNDTDESKDPINLGNIPDFQPKCIIVWMDRRKDRLDPVETQISSNIDSFRLFYDDDECVKYLMGVTKRRVFLIRDKEPNLNFKVYRGQRMNAKDFQQLRSNRGGLISMNTFMSTTKDKELATRYAGFGEERPACESCLFEIEINPLMDINRIVFASIKDQSNFQEEAEILFSVGMILRIQSIEEKNGLWYIKLISDVIKDSPAKEVNEINEKIFPSNCHRNTHILYYIVELYVEIGDYNMAVEYYNKYNNAEHHDPHCIKDLSNGLLYTAIAMRHYRKSEWIIVMEYLQQAANIQKVFSPFHPTLGLTYNLIGNIYRSFKKDYALASMYHEKSDNIFNKPPTVNYDVGLLNSIQHNVAGDYSNLGDNIRLSEFVKNIVDNKMSSMKKLYNMAKTSDNQLLFLDTTGDTLTANTHALHDNGSESINQTNESLNTVSFIPSKTLYFSYFQLGEKYAIEQDFENALINFEKGIEEQQKFLPYEHPSFIPSYNVIASVLYQLKDYKRMLHYLEKVLHIHHSRHPVNHRQIFGTYHNMLEAYISLKDEQGAWKCSEVLLDLSFKYDYPETKMIQQIQDALMSKHPKSISKSEISAYPSYNEEKFNCYGFEDTALLRNS
ncbi:unnamed protein product [Didymodactylos carnosus]|uniref:Uncharacterized protein n=1 Tax=Didymodactylos carnosus TaxID=1234261 RepID=A0A814ZBX2_9BILA|nr:unnamed protein product [Didymodactylos carnosus]CAF4003662.1 unnamed protein product [Didymodactylos carnosus]